MDATTHSFQSEHAPRGAAASFSIGHVGSGGGFSHECGTTADQDVYIGTFQDGRLLAWPYNAQGRDAVDTGMSEFIPTGDPESAKHPPVEVAFLGPEQITRDYRLATDTITGGGVTLSIATPVSGIPEPTVADASAVKDAICPALAATLTFDNAAGTTPLRGFFALGGLGGFKLLDELTGGELAGLVTRDGYGLAIPSGEGVRCFSDMFMDFPFRRPEPNRNFMTGVGGVLIDVAPGERRTMPLALGWYRGGTVMLGKDCQYLYTRHFAGLTDVLAYALSRAEAWRDEADRHDAAFAANGLNEHRRFLYAKALRSYWGNSQLLVEGSRPRWVVNEGSCNMNNTLDLTVDMAFFECRQHPWLLRNVLDAFADEYSYRDEVTFPHDKQTLHPGGVSFTHDQGFRGTYSRPGYSHYEAANHPACFSYMTCEELLNWTLCAGLYVTATDDAAWLRRRAGLIDECLTSLQHRDHPDPEQRDGLMSLDSSRCGTSEEITTYDSLDPSLGQARRNAYMGVKAWAAYLAIAEMLRRDGAARWSGRIAEARAAADLAAGTVAGAFDEELGYIPAILEGEDRSAIIPVIEALVYPPEMGLDEAVAADGPFGGLIAALGRHLDAVLVEGRCLFADGGWKLSAGSDNSWMSKIFICQHVAETVLGRSPDVRADGAHDHWWRVGCARQSVVDQVIAGESKGRGATYPRTVSGVLWLG